MSGVFADELRAKIARLDELDQGAGAAFLEVWGDTLRQVDGLEEDLAEALALLEPGDPRGP